MAPHTRSDELIGDIRSPLESSSIKRVSVNLCCRILCPAKSAEFCLLTPVSLAMANSFVVRILYKGLSECGLWLLCDLLSMGAILSAFNITPMDVSWKESTSNGPRPPIVAPWRCLCCLVFIW